MPTAFQLTCAPIPLVRIALIGLGQRGMKTLQRYRYIPGAEIRYVADIDPKRLAAANKALAASGRPEACTLLGREAWKEACGKEDVDLVYICTEWRLHTPMAVEAMRRGKHVAVEVPAATTIEECRLLIRTAEETQRHCFMTENCCYDFFALQTASLVASGRLGEITHCEGAYIHNLTVPSRQTGGMTDTRQNWIEQSCMQHGGNPYPTHGIGPIAQLLGIHRYDRFTHLVSMTADGIKTSKGDLLGRVNTTLIKTAMGKTVLLQLDVTTPRPYNRLQTVCATKGFVQKYPTPTLQLAGEEPLVGQAALDAMAAYSDSAASKCWLEGRRLNVANEMNYAMDARLIECLQQGLPLDIDVYDAAEWSCIAELSRLSAVQGGIPVAFPNFFTT